MSLNGNVKSIRELTFRAVATNGEIQKGELLYYYLNTFDQRGNKITDNKYNPDGKMDKKYEYSYDSAGNRLEQRQWRGGC